MFTAVYLLFAVNIRNLALEKVAEQVSFPCRFTGCSVLMMAGDKTKHELFCDFRSVLYFVYSIFCTSYMFLLYICTEISYIW